VCSVYFERHLNIDLLATGLVRYTEVSLSVKLYSGILEVFSSNLYLDVGYLHRGYASFSPAPAVKIRYTGRNSANTDDLQVTISLRYYGSQYGEGHKMNQKMMLRKQQTNLPHVRQKIAKSRSAQNFTKALLITVNISIAVTYSFHLSSRYW